MLLSRRGRLVTCCGCAWPHFNRRYKLILKSRRSKPLMSLQVQTLSCESVDGQQVIESLPPPRLTRPAFWDSSDTSFFSRSIQEVFQGLDCRSVLLCSIGVVLFYLCRPSLDSVIWQSSARSLAVSQSERQAVSKWNANEPLQTLWAKWDGCLYQCLGFSRDSGSLREEKTLDVSQKVSSPTKSESV